MVGHGVEEYSVHVKQYSTQLQGLVALQLQVAVYCVFIIAHKLQSCADGFALLLVTGLVEQCEHVFLVSLNTGLVEGVNTKNVAADAATNLEEIDELSQIVLVEFGDRDAHIGNTAVYVCKLCTELGHLVNLVYVFAGEEVKAVEVLLVTWNGE